MLNLETWGWLDYNPLLYDFVSLTKANYSTSHMMRQKNRPVQTKMSLLNDY